MQAGAQLLQPPQGAEQLGAALQPPQGAAQLGAAQLGALHLWWQRVRGARQQPRRPASASPTTRTSANRAPNTNIILRTISNSSLDLGRSFRCRAAPRRPKQPLQLSPRFELVSTQTFQVEATPLKLAIEGILSNEAALRIIQFGYFLRSGWRASKPGFCPEKWQMCLKTMPKELTSEDRFLPGRGKRKE